MLKFLRKFESFSDKKSCDHPGVSFSLGMDSPGFMRCHFCDHVKVTYDTGHRIADTLHTRTKVFWVLPDETLERALATSPREFGDLRIEKWLRNKGYLK